MKHAHATYDALVAFQSEALDVHKTNHPSSWGLSPQRRTLASQNATKQGLKRTEHWKYTFWNKYWPQSTQWQDAPALSVAQLKDIQASNRKQISTVNGYLSPLSKDLQTQLEASGIYIYHQIGSASLPQKISHKVEQYLAHIALEDEDTLTALNTARTPDVCLIYVSRNHHLDEIPTLSLKHIHTHEDQASQVFHPRVLLIAESESQIHLIEEFTNEQEGLCNHVIEMVAEQQAHITYTRVQHESLTRQHVGKVALKAESQSSIQAHFLNLGAHLSRLDIDVDLVSSEAKVELYGLFTGSDTQHLDQHIMMKHHAAHCVSNQSFKGILNHKSQGIFTGKVYVAPGAHHTQAEQNNPNLLLSTQAKAIACPQLEIYNDEVECSHGATVGQLDPYALFYLKSRGIKHEAAIQMLTKAFASEIKEYIPNALHPIVDQAIARTLSIE